MLTALPARTWMVGELARFGRELEPDRTGGHRADHGPNDVERRPRRTKTPRPPRRHHRRDGQNLPPARLLRETGVLHRRESDLYPRRDLRSELIAYLGAPVKQINVGRREAVRPADAYRQHPRMRRWLTLFAVAAGGPNAQATAP